MLADEHSPYDQLSQEFRLEGTAFSDRMAWVTGLYGFTENAMGRARIAFMRGLTPPEDLSEAPLWEAFGPIALGARENVSRRQQTDATNKSWAVFAAGTLDITDAWSVTAGWRWTRDTRQFKRSQWTSDFEFDLFYACPGNIGPDGLALLSYCKEEVSFSQSTPRVIVNYAFTDDVMAYLSFSRGYSSGGMNGDPRMRPYAPEISDNWELGMKSQWFERRLQLNATIFQNDYENQQITIGRVVDGQPIADQINAQAATFEGYELELLATRPRAGSSREPTGTSMATMTSSRSSTTPLTRLPSRKHS